MTSPREGSAMEAEIRERHLAVTWENRCAHCDTPVPCDTAFAMALVEKLRRERDEARVALALSDLPHMGLRESIRSQLIRDGLVALAQVDTLRERVRALEEALRAADSVMWMAHDYAEGGGSGGPELRDFKRVKATVDAALASARAAGYEP